VRCAITATSSQRHLLAGPRQHLIFSFVGGPLTVAVSLAAALLVNAKLTRFKALFRTIYFTPVVTTLVAVSLVFKYLYHPRFGMVNRALAAVGITGPDWLGDPKWALFSIILLAVWRQFRLLDDRLHRRAADHSGRALRSARIDGAGPLRQFRHVTLPLLGPTFPLRRHHRRHRLPAALAEPYVMTRGGPLNKTSPWSC